ncbi:hypothetical protein [Candidatus Nitrososphaera evergladensis]|uniref:hypothetical protein n=1 Tax=Candidatus Nitrososphaera evergladensis TaxID=1459637 RepID=UPI0011E5BC61|nr:hypothetical protein [Candidatus Nitrososphaera evergladensis]
MLLKPASIFAQGKIDVTSSPAYFGNLPSALAASDNNNSASADNTWYIGKGTKPDTYVKYAINNLGTNNNQTFIMTIYFKDYNVTGKYWIAPVYIFDAPNKENNIDAGRFPHLVNGTFLLNDETMRVIQGSDIPQQLAQYKDAYGYSLDWLSDFATKSSPRSLSQPSWGKAASLGGIEIWLKSTETLTVPAGTFNTTVITWHKGAAASDSKIWVNKDFPYPIKARVYSEVIHPPAPIWFEFELLEYGKGSLLNRWQSSDYLTLN